MVIHFVLSKILLFFSNSWILERCPEHSNDFPKFGFDPQPLLKYEVLQQPLSFIPTATHRQLILFFAMDHPTLLLSGSLSAKKPSRGRRRGGESSLLVTDGHSYVEEPVGIIGLLRRPARLSFGAERTKDILSLINMVALFSPVTGK